MYGICLGDLAGCPWEYSGIGDQDPETMQIIDASSCPTDDTVMAYAVMMAAKHLYDHPGMSDQDVKAKYAEMMRQYGRKNPDAGYGGGFMSWFQSDDLASYNSFGNGSAMRSGTIGAVFEDQESVIRHAYLASCVSHDHPEGIKGGILTAMSVYMAVNGAEKEDICRYIADHYHGGFRSTEEYYADTKRCLDPTLALYALKDLEPITQRTVSQITMPETAICLRYSHDFESAIRNTFRFLNDHDTTAAIVGGISAALYRDIRFEEKNYRDVKRIIQEKLMMIDLRG